MHLWMWDEEEGEARMTLSLGSWDHLLREPRGLVGSVRVDCCQLWNMVYAIRRFG